MRRRASRPQLKRDPLGGPMSTVKIIAVAATLGGLGAAACATTAGSLSGQVWRMKIADDGRLVILDSAVVGEWRGGGCYCRPPAAERPSLLCAPHRVLV